MRLLSKILIFAISSVGIGLLSAWYMIAVGSGITVATVGPWKSWYNEGSPDADPYTRAHIIRSGRLPITSTGARYFNATTDSAGDPLMADCEYHLVGKSIEALWWGIAVYDKTGRSLPNKLERYGFNKDNLYYRDDGVYEVRIAQSARSDNWLPSSGVGPMTIVLRIYRPKFPNELSNAESAAELLPTITKISCS
jgi:hypothetical protein